MAVQCGRPSTPQPHPTMCTARTCWARTGCVTLSRLGFLGVACLVRWQHHHSCSSYGAWDRHPASALSVQTTLLFVLPETAQIHRPAAGARGTGDEGGLPPWGLPSHPFCRFIVAPLAALVGAAQPPAMDPTAPAVDSPGDLNIPQST